jgi:hypothetical protein
MRTENCKKTSPAKVLLLCGGEASRWNNYLGVNKHFVQVDGESLIENTCKKLISSGFNEIVIAGRGEEYAIDLADYFCVPEFGCSEPVNKFLSTRNFWEHQESSVLLFGDVYFSQQAINAAKIRMLGKIFFIGRMTPSRITGCDYMEIFGLSFGAEAVPEILSALEEIKQLASERPTGWQLYKILADRTAINEEDNQVEVNFIHIDDFTEDFDFPEDYDRWCAAREKREVRDPNPLDIFKKSLETRYQKRKKRLEHRWKFALLLGGVLGFIAGNVLL